MDLAIQYEDNPFSLHKRSYSVPSLASGHGIDEQLMMVLLSGMQTHLPPVVAEMAKICSQRLRDLHDHMQREFEIERRELKRKLKHAERAAEATSMKVEGYPMESGTEEFKMGENDEGQNNERGLLDMYSSMGTAEVAEVTNLQAEPSMGESSEGSESDPGMTQNPSYDWGLHQEQEPDNDSDAGHAVGADTHNSPSGLDIEDDFEAKSTSNSDMELASGTAMDPGMGLIVTPEAASLHDIEAEPTRALGASNLERSSNMETETSMETISQEAEPVMGVEAVSGSAADETPHVSDIRNSDEVPSVGVRSAVSALSAGLFSGLVHVRLPFQVHAGGGGSIGSCSVSSLVSGTEFFDAVSEGTEHLKMESGASERSEDQGAVEIAQEAVTQMMEDEGTHELEQEAPAQPTAVTNEMEDSKPAISDSEETKSAISGGSYLLENDFATPDTWRSKYEGAEDTPRIHEAMLAQEGAGQSTVETETIAEKLFVVEGFSQFDRNYYIENFSLAGVQGALSGFPCVAPKCEVIASPLHAFHGFDKAYYQTNFSMAGVQGALIAFSSKPPEQVVDTGMPGQEGKEAQAPPEQTKPQEKTRISNLSKRFRGLFGTLWEKKNIPPEPTQEEAKPAEKSPMTPEKKVCSTDKGPKKDACNHTFDIEVKPAESDAEFPGSCGKPGNDSTADSDVKKIKNDTSGNTDSASESYFSLGSLGCDDADVSRVMISGTEIQSIDGSTLDSTIELELDSNLHSSVDCSGAGPKKLQWKSSAAALSSNSAQIARSMIAIPKEASNGRPQWNVPEAAPDPSPTAQISFPSYEKVSCLREQGTEAFHRGDVSQAIDHWCHALDAVAQLSSDKGCDLQHMKELRVTLLLNMSLGHKKQKKWSEAVKYCDEALQEQPQNAKALYRKAESLAELGKWKEAEQVVSLLEKLGWDSYSRSWFTAQLKNAVSGHAASGSVPKATPQEVPMQMPRKEERQAEAPLQKRECRHFNKEEVKPGKAMADEEMPAKAIKEELQKRECRHFTNEEVTPGKAMEVEQKPGKTVKEKEQFLGAAADECSATNTGKSKYEVKPETARRQEVHSIEAKKQRLRGADVSKVDQNSAVVPKAEAEEAVAKAAQARMKAAEARSKAMQAKAAAEEAIAKAEAQKKAAQVAALGKWSPPEVKPICLDDLRRSGFEWEDQDFSDAVWLAGLSRLDASFYHKKGLPMTLVAASAMANIEIQEEFVVHCFLDGNLATFAEPHDWAVFLKRCPKVKSLTIVYIDIGAVPAKPDSQTPLNMPSGTFLQPTEEGRVGDRVVRTARFLGTYREFFDHSLVHSCRDFPALVTPHLALWADVPLYGMGEADFERRLGALTLLGRRGLPCVVTLGGEIADPTGSAYVPQIDESTKLSLGILDVGLGITTLIGGSWQWNRFLVPLGPGNHGIVSAHAILGVIKIRDDVLPSTSAVVRMLQDQQISCVAQQPSPQQSKRPISQKESAKVQQLIQVQWAAFRKKLEAEGRPHRPDAPAEERDRLAIEFYQFCGCPEGEIDMKRQHRCAG
eukprot:gnl/MRDRNA2_/MRDRNA2_98212_c0_seq1.p1 gnl/MRDRNA2_/MRDRNA2_98212_c0~~gnl/MRDRNA2_/MRDRNA2_98212_c0_seq1.p1  ORF type:complete len:1534 (-),score=423.27 gnl/MRDRNA2_/MRDRNA2_98212_c0_seq1:200-4801(-)